MGIRHEGINKNRLSREPLEARFAEAWKREAPRVLGYILCGPDRNHHDFSQRDAEVAASIIQWLGSHVGSCFVTEVMESEIKANIAERAASHRN
jgi:hypothetical protein